MNQELIEQGKNNLAKFYRMPEELQKVVYEAGTKNCLLLGSNGSWGQCHCDCGFDSGTRYRIRPDYQPSSRYVDYKLGICGTSSKFHIAGLPVTGFVGYVSDRGEVMSSRVMYRIGDKLMSWVPADLILGKDYHIVESVAVRFKEIEK